jgi:hypothetical protein
MAKTKATSVQMSNNGDSLTSTTDSAETVPMPEPSVNDIPSSPSIEEQQANHPTMKWYDEFHVRIQKKIVRNVLGGREESIITGWELVKKLHAKFIEPSLAKYFNQFANGYYPENIGCYLVPKGTMTTGDVIPYKQWADEQGIDPKNDIHQVLA